MRSRWHARGFVVDPVLMVAACVIVGFVILGWIGPLLWRRSATDIDLLRSLHAPSFGHPLGTDEYGRDVLARFMVGARISLVLGVIVVGVGGLCGGLIGLVAGVSGGTADALLMRIMDAILAFPPLILAMAVTIGLGVGLETAALGITLSSIPWYARIVRSEALRIRSLHFVESSYALGAGRLHVVRRHILPNLAATWLIQGASVFGYSILALAALGFVGLGAQIPTPEWGAMITDGLQYALTGQWWIGVFPGVGLLIVVTAANIIADRSRDLLDPRGSLARTSARA